MQWWIPYKKSWRFNQPGAPVAARFGGYPAMGASPPSNDVTMAAE